MARVPHGFFVAADGGAAVFLPEADLATRVAAAFGVRAGYHSRIGLALTLGFDDLGVQPSRGGGALLVPSFAVRYSLPFIVEPFAEVMVGGAFDSVMASPTAGLGFGLSVPVVRHLALEVGIRSWVLNVDGSLKDIPSLELGAAVGFTGH